MTRKQVSTSLPPTAAFHDLAVGPVNTPSESEPRALLLDASTHAYVTMEGIADTLGLVLHNAVDGGHAVARALECTYEVLIVDPSLAGEGGGTISQLLTLQPAATLLLAGEAEQWPAICQQESRLLGSLRKPWHLEEVHDALNRALTLTRIRRSLAERSRRAGSPGPAILMASDRVSRLRLQPTLAAAFERPQVTWAPSMEEALQQLAGQHFDAAAISLTLPDACGLDALVRFRSAAPKLPVVALAPSEDEALLELAFQTGAQEVLPSGRWEGPQLLRALKHAVKRQRAVADINHRALHDELTSLAKRTLLHQRVSNALARCRRLGHTFALMYIDLDRFKWINDTYGHDVGDSVLVAVSDRLKSAVREYDTVARLGGDEFAVLLDTLEEPTEAERIAQRILSMLAEPISVVGTDLEVTASMGISVFPEGGSGVEELLKNADQAMYCAKRSGRNTYSLTPVMDSSPASRRTSVRAPLLG